MRRTQRAPAGEARPLLPRSRRRSPRGRLRRWLAGALACAFLVFAAAPAAARPRLEGRPLSEALRTLQAEGLSIVFTSELVRPEMVVAGEPAARRPRRVLDEVLAPHGLGVREGPGGVLVVVARPSPEVRRPAIAGTVRARGGRRGLAGSVVRVVEPGLERPAGEDGSFSFAELAPGDYTLEAVAPGYLTERVSRVTVAAGRTRRVELRLTPRPFVEDEIVVRPSRLALLQEGPDSSFSLGREEIDSLPHLGGDLFRATSLLPGTAANDVSAGFSVHGGRRDEVRILLDGQELYEAFHLKDFDSALSIVAAEGLAGATLSTGAFPVRQGDRMSGVLDLRTVEPGSGRRFVLGLSVLDALASGAGTFAGDRGGWLAIGRRGSLDLAGAAVGDEHPAFWDVFTKAQLDTGHGLLSAHLLTAVDTLVVDKADEESFERLDNEYRSTYGWLRHQLAPREGLLVETVASWAAVRRDRGGVGVEEDGGFALRDRRRLEVLALSQDWTLQLGPRHLPRWGLEARRYDAAFDYAKALEPEIVVLAPFAPPRATEHAFDGTLTGEHLGLWASDQLSLGRLSSEIGARWDRHTASDETLLSPRLNLAWRLGERSVVRAAWGRFFQSQRPYELQVEDGEEALFRAERSDHAVLGYEVLPSTNPLGLEAVRLEVFHRRIENPRRRYENLLEPLNVFVEIEPDRVRLDPERGTAEGVEVLLRGRWGTRLSGWLAYTVSRAEERIGGAVVRRSLDQPHALALDLDYRLPGSWSLNLAWRYHTGWPTTPVGEERVLDPEEPDGEPQPVAVFGPLNSTRLPAYHRLDLRASRRLDLGPGRLTFFVDVQNLYDRRNLAGFDVTFEDDELLLEPEHWPGIFPSFGITWEM